MGHYYIHLSQKQTKYTLLLKTFPNLLLILNLILEIKWHRPFSMYTVSPVHALLDLLG